jgi:hypothetical protein
MALEGKALPIAAVARHTATASPARPIAHTAASGAPSAVRRAPRRSGRHAGGRLPRVRITPVSPAASPDVDRLVVATGILTALSLAVLGGS